TTQPVQLCQAVVRCACHRVGGRSSLADPSGLLGGLCPRSVQLKDLGPMYLASATVWHKAGLGVTPPTECSSPFAGALHVEALHADRDHRAIGKSDESRRPLGRNDID